MARKCLKFAFMVNFYDITEHNVQFCWLLLLLQDFLDEGSNVSTCIWVQAP